MPAHHAKAWYRQCPSAGMAITGPGCVASPIRLPNVGCVQSITRVANVASPSRMSFPRLPVWVMPVYLGGVECRDSQSVGLHAGVGPPWARRMGCQSRRGRWPKARMAKEWKVRRRRDFRKMGWRNPTPQAETVIHCHGVSPGVVCVDLVCAPVCFWISGRQVSQFGAGWKSSASAQRGSCVCCERAL